MNAFSLLFLSFFIFAILFAKTMNKVTFICNKADFDPPIPFTPGVDSSTQLHLLSDL